MPHVTNVTAKILYIEGHSALRDVYTQLFEFRSEYNINVAKNGLEALEMAQSWQPDLIVMGLRMPGLNGFEVIERLRSKPITAQTPIIVISAWSNATSKKRALAAGANEHLTPPVDIEWLLKRIRTYLKQRR